MGDSKRRLSRERLSLVHRYMVHGAAGPPVVEAADGDAPTAPAPEVSGAEPEAAPVEGPSHVPDPPVAPHADPTGSAPPVPEPTPAAVDALSPSEGDRAEGTDLPIYAWVKAEMARGEWRRGWPEELVRLKQERTARRS